MAASCKNNHELDLKNTYIRPNGAKVCKTCRCLSAERYRRKKGIGPRAKRTRCKWGHMLTEENIYNNPSGQEVCRICRKEYHAEYRKKNKARLQEYYKDWQGNNRDKVQANSSKWCKNNPEKRRERVRKRRALKRNQLGIVSPDIEKTLLNNQRNNCFYCNICITNISTHVDHKTPISRGGVHEDSNLCLTCVPCNLSKGTMTEKEFLDNVSRRTK